MVVNGRDSICRLTGSNEGTGFQESDGRTCGGRPTLIDYL